MPNKNKSTGVVRYHYFRLAYRIILLLITTSITVYCIFTNQPFEINFNSKFNIFLICVWAIFMIEMLCALIPTGHESPGSQKHFKCKYKKTGKTQIKIQDNHAVLLVGLLWLSINVVFGALKLLGILSDGSMFLLFSIYSVCDCICVLFFCPFQTWFLKNECCVQCRIYNWNYAMMFTPMFFVTGAYSWTLVAMALIILFKWEITVYKHPERFSRETNEYLECKHCSELLCKNKKQLKTFWDKLDKYKEEKIEQLKKH